jgi:hypothetical protein
MADRFIRAQNQAIEDQVIYVREEEIRRNCDQLVLETRARVQIYDRMLQRDDLRPHTQHFTERDLGYYRNVLQYLELECGNKSLDVN